MFLFFYVKGVSDEGERRELRDGNRDGRIPIGSRRIGVKWRR